MGVLGGLADRPVQLLVALPFMVVHDLQHEPIFQPEFDQLEKSRRDHMTVPSNLHALRSQIFRPRRVARRYSGGLRCTAMG